jgi:nitrogen fixation protein NifU and related proteins
MSDVQSRDGQGWFYSEIVKDHFRNPRNFLEDKDVEMYSKEADGVGTEGSPACGDVMKMWIKVHDNRITECRWQTFGCASAIASTSMYSTMITENGGMTVEEALEVKPKNILEKLGGLPNNKIHCSVLADKAFRAAANNYFIKTNQYDKVDNGYRVDKALGITSEDIEDAVLEGARTFQELQDRTKIGVEDKDCIPEAKKLLEHYIEKHFSEEFN